MLLHQPIVAATGGSPDLRDIDLLDSASESVFRTFGGQELYPAKEEKGARPGFSLISNHAFVDGNKRIGMHVMLTFPEVNGIHMDCTNEDVVEAGLGVASGTMKYDALPAWVRQHRIPRTVKGGPYETEIHPPGKAFEKGPPRAGQRTPRRVDRSARTAGGGEQKGI